MYVCVCLQIIGCVFLSCIQYLEPDHNIMMIQGTEQQARTNGSVKIWLIVLPQVKYEAALCRQAVLTCF